MLSISEEPDSFLNGLQPSFATRTGGEKSASLGPVPASGKPQVTGRGFSTQASLGHHQQPSVPGVLQNHVVIAMTSQSQMNEVEQQKGVSLR